MTAEQILIRMKFLIKENRWLNGDTLLMRLEGDTGTLTRPGQFVNLSVDGCFLRRPISVCDYDGEGMTLIYEVIGRGTETMSRLRPGEEVEMLSGLGNGFDADVECSNPVLLGGGIGAAPLYNLARRLLARNIQPTVILGFNTAERVVMRDMFEDLGVETALATVDGSAGVKGFVTDVLAKSGMHPDYFYACGPMPMMESLCHTMQCDGELSLDVRMACGFGACMCCSLMTRKGPVCVCKDGPVFKKEDLIWKM